VGGGGCAAGELVAAASGGGMKGHGCVVCWLHSTPAARPPRGVLHVAGKGSFVAAMAPHACTNWW